MNETKVIIGNLGNFTELKEVETKDGLKTVANFQVATNTLNDDGEKITTWHRCVAWHDLARGIEQTPKGTRLIITGYENTRSYTNSEGEEKQVTEIQARNIGKDISIRKEVKDEDGEPF